MERLRELAGRERSLNEVTQTLHFFARELAADHVGAMLVTCADESERECVEAFQHGFVQFLLPPIKFAQQSAFRLATLGGRYEWGAARVAEQHFALPPGPRGFKLLVIKINAHVAIESTPPTGQETDARGSFVRIGHWKRYDSDSACCGALAALLADAREPFGADLREAFLSEGQDRIAMLLDENRVEPAYRALYAAIVSARLQARKAVLDMQDYRPTTPTYYVVLPAVTINRHDRDTEIACGVYSVDGRDDAREAVYFGLGDDPSAYEITLLNRRFVVTDPQVASTRKGRDHRAMALVEWRRRTEGKPLEIRDERLDRIRTDMARSKHGSRRQAKTLLRAALPILAQVAPVPAAMLMFAEGAVGIHHAFCVHRLAREMEGTDEAKRILHEIHDQVDRLEPDRAEALMELLMREYGR